MSASSEHLKLLLARYKTADVAAFSEFFRDTRKIVFAYAISRAKSTVEAEDIVQDTYLRVHKYILSYNDSYPPIAWLLGIARNVWIDRLKANPRFEPLHPNLADPEDSQLRQDAKEFLTAVVSELTDEEQQILYRRILSQDSFEDVAKGLGISAASARKRVSRLIKKLRSKFQPS